MERRRSEMAKQLALVIDLDRCIGCKGGCIVACKTEHEIALGPSRCRVLDVGPTGTYPDLQMYFLPVMCQQCEDPPCVAVCPTGACYKREEDGVVTIDRDRCVGCGSCRRACPYGAMNFNNEMHCMDKCDICLDTRVEGGIPACVRNCSGSAIHYGDLNDPESEVARLLREAGDAVYSLPDQGNRPSGRFILRNAVWQEVPLGS